MPSGRNRPETRPGRVFAWVLGVPAALVAGAVAFSLAVIREVTPFRETEAIALLARGRPPARELPVSAYVPGTLRLARRPTPHSAEIAAEFVHRGVRFRRSAVLRFRPEIVSFGETNLGRP